MKTISRCMLLVMSTLCAGLWAAVPSTPCVLLDLEGHEEIVYDPFLGLLRSAGFAPQYQGLNTFADDTNISERLATESKGLFLVVNADFLANMKVSPLGKKLTAVLDRITQVPNYFVCLLLPSFNNVQPGMAMVPALRELFEPLGIDISPIQLERLEQNAQYPISVRLLTAAACNRYLAQSMNSRPMPYHTTLSLPHGGRPFFNRLLAVANEHPDLSLTLLPKHVERFASPKIRGTLPYFLYTHSSLKKLHILIGHGIMANGFGITEQFHIRPLKTSLAKEMLELMGFGLAQFHALVTQAEPDKKNFHAVVKSVAKPDFRPVVDTFGKMKNRESVSPLPKVAWMELAIFEPLCAEQAKKQSLHDREQRQKKLIKHLVQAKFDGLWITFNPHQYWSPIARKKDREAVFLASVSNFTQQLAAACKRAKRPVPALLVGFEITNNVYLPNLPTMCAADTFGNEFTDIPAPLHEPFWQNEIIKPLETLCERWKDPQLSHGIPLRGVVLDLEMYCRKRIGSFTPVCGFDRETLTAFDPTLVGPGFTVHKAVQALMDSSRYSAFLAARTDKAKQLGQMMRAAFKKALGDDAYIMCYVQNLMIDWFYKGLYQGLSTKEEPLELLTFNAEFMRHRPWLEQQGIFANHGCVVLLSKIMSTRHFGYVNNVLQANQSVWLNRVSRLVEDYEPTSWVGVEQTPLNDQGKKRFIRHMATV